MKRWLCCLMLLAVLTVPAGAVELPEELADALPRKAAELLEDVDPSGTEGFADGVGKLLREAGTQAGRLVKKQARGAASVLLVVVLCSLISGVSQGTDSKNERYVAMAGALAVMLLTAGSLDSLIGLGEQTIGDLQTFSKALLPTLAAATAAAGAVTTATFQQVTTVFLADLLLSLIDGLLMPLTYCYIGALTAAACLPESRLGAIAEGLKKVITWILTTVLIAFTLYLSIARVLSGSVDTTAVRLAKTTISQVVPVVGGIIAEASETVLAGAGLVKNTIGVFGMLGILAACIHPFLHLGVQYLLYKLTGFFSSVVGAPSLSRLINGLGGAFGLVLGMTGASALLLLISVLSCVAAVTP